MIRNTASEERLLQLQINYMSDHGPVTSSVKDIGLEPFTTRDLDLPSILKELQLTSLNGSMNVKCTFLGRGGDLDIAAGSVDQTGTYVFEVAPDGAGPSRTRIGEFWSIADGDDTMITLWNPSDAAQNITLTLLFGDGSGTYDIPVRLEAGASRMLDLMDLMKNMRPDPDGRTVPSGIQTGSFRIQSSTRDLDPVGSVMSVGIYNISNATCNIAWSYCCGVTSVTPPANFSIGVNKSTLVSG